jgi:thioredoxin reductase/Pyruvate/2-oxoacid:ferredoxin oxidoreductase delta subunit
MDWPFIIGTTLVLLVTFVVIGAWQRKLERDRSAKVVTAMGEARAKGKHMAVAQYPFINATLCIGCGTCIEACPEDQVIGLVEGIATIVNGSRCIGHAKCEEVCPVNAIQVGLGDVSSRADMPILTPAQESTVPGLYIAGELSGIALIRHAVDQGVKVMDDIAAKLKAEGPSKPGIYDVFVVGAGPAGFSASLRAMEHKLTYKTISQDEIGGTVGKYPRQKMTIVQTLNIPLHGKLNTGVYEKEMLIKMWGEIQKKTGLVLDIGTSITGAERKGDHFEIKTSKGVEKARRLVLALGRRGTPRKLGVPGEDLFKVLYALQDAATYTNQHLLVVGGGDSAIEAATGLANQPGNVVTLSYRKEEFFRIKPRNEQRIKEYGDSGKVNVMMSSDIELVEEKRVVLKTPKGKTPKVDLQNDVVFVFAGGELPFPLLKQMGIKFGSAPQRRADRVST